MSLKLTSMLKILNQLDKGIKVTRTALADKMGVTPRTIDRYISALLDADFPIQYDREKKSYVFGDNYHLGKADFSAEETLVLSLARSALKKDFGPRTVTVLDAIENKIGLCEPGLPKHIILSSNVQSPSVEEYFRLLNQAIPNCRKVEITYKALHDKETTCRTVDPYYLFYNEGIWLLRGYCHLRKQMRTFALDKMITLRVLDSYYLPKAHIVAEEEMSGTFGSMVTGNPVTVVLRFMKEFAPYIQRRKWHPSQQIKEFKDGSIEATFRVNGFKGIKPWMYRWIPYVEVVKPKELKEEVKMELNLSVRKYLSKR